MVNKDDYYNIESRRRHDDDLSNLVMDVHCASRWLELPSYKAL